MFSLEHFLKIFKEFIFGSEKRKLFTEGLSGRIIDAAKRR